MKYYIDVIVPLPLDNIFTYQVNLKEFEFIKVGFRVIVPFGKSKFITAIVYNKHNKNPEFYIPKEIEFIIDEETLDPRPDSEILIEAVLEHFSNNKELLKILDLGSGSGCLGLSLLEEYEGSTVSFVDVSKKSLKIVKKNALKLNLKGQLNYINLDWNTHDWDTKLLNSADKTKFDIIGFILELLSFLDFLSRTLLLVVDL